ncbi:MOSC domain-containing protein [Aliikangiella maris]|uniref:MOSC domain-containing protein n=2 Tax=Aliikangiella maris TaxID=3162458 RepID=A0ABV2BR45_9GAMM
MSANPKTFLSEISIYPVKSLSGIQLDEAKVETIGLQQDRTMMLIDENNVFITQRKYPELALLEVKLKHNTILIKSPKQQPIQISASDFQVTPLPVTIWKDNCYGCVASESINSWFSEYLGFTVKLVTYYHTNPRPTDVKYSKPGDIVSYADGYPVLVISSGSLADLNSRLQQPVSMKHFRPNIVIDNCEPYAEDDWQQIRIGEVIFDAVKPCSRCILTTVNPQTGIKDPQQEPLKTLTQYRKFDSGIIFGKNLIPHSSGKIKLGDQLTIIR